MSQSITTASRERVRVIVVMGPTGSGKTTLVNYISKREEKTGVGRGILPCTAQVELVQVEEPIEGRKVLLVDTPGFDDPARSDVEILRMIANYLVGTHNTALQVDTILFLHRIIDTRMTASLLKNLRLFASLCGNQSMPNVVIVTTMWSNVTQEEGQIREKEMGEMVWYDMIEKGCSVKRFERTYQSALEILAVKGNMVDGTLLSNEMVNSKKPLKATTAANELAKEIEKAIKSKKRDQSEEQLDTANGDIDKLKEQRESLRRGFFDRLFGPKPEMSLIPEVGERMSRTQPGLN